MAIFDHAHSKIIESTSSFPEFTSAWEKTTLFHLFIFDHAHLKNFQSSLTCVKLHQHAKNWPKIFQSTFNFCEFVSTCKKWGWFIDLHWRYAWFKNLAIWMTESILGAWERGGGAKDIFPKIWHAQLDRVF